MKILTNELKNQIYVPKYTYFYNELFIMKTL